MDKVIGTVYKTLFDRKYVEYVIAKVASNEDGNRYFFEVVHKPDIKDIDTLGSFKNIWASDKDEYDFDNWEQLEDDIYYVNWPLDGLELYYNPVKATKLAKKMYPKAEEKDGFLLIRSKNE